MRENQNTCRYLNMRVYLDRDTMRRAMARCLDESKLTSSKYGLARRDVKVSVHKPIDRYLFSHANNLGTDVLCQQPMRLIDAIAGDSGQDGLLSSTIEDAAYLNPAGPPIALLFGRLKYILP